MRDDCGVGAGVALVEGDGDGPLDGSRVARGDGRVDGLGDVFPVFSTERSVVGRVTLTTWVAGVRVTGGASGVTEASVVDVAGVVGGASMGGVASVGGVAGVAIDSTIGVVGEIGLDGSGGAVVPDAEGLAVFRSDGAAAT